MSFIAALAENGVIGRNNQLPWRLSRDLQYFKQATLGKPVVMGRHTFESLPKALPGRVNIIISRRAELAAVAPPDVVAAGDSVWVSDVSQAIELAQAICDREELDEWFVIGGAQLYEALLAEADRLYLTRVQARPDGDAFFPALNLGDWRLLRSESHEADERNEHAMIFEVYERR
ncbi:dihydrofolate reductase [bacterium]|nr:dihydrofolate reductase [bacterium]